MAGYGVPEADIARVLGIDPKTLRKHYRDELDTGHIVANAKVAESLFRKATGDHRQSVTAAIFGLKTRAGWKEASPNDPDPAVEFPTRIIITCREATTSPDSGALPLPRRLLPLLAEALLERRQQVDHLGTLRRPLIDHRMPGRLARALGWDELL